MPEVSRHLSPEAAQMTQRGKASLSRWSWNKRQTIDFQFNHITGSWPLCRESTLTGAEDIVASFLFCDACQPPNDPCRDAVLSLHYFLFWPIWILSISMEKHGAKSHVFRNYSATFMEQEPFWHKANEVNDSFTKVAVLSGDYARFVRISCAFCPLLLRVLSILK